MRAGTIAAGRFPGALAFASELYVANAGDGTVVGGRPDDTGALPPIPVGAQPSGLATSPDGKLLYVADSGSDNVTVIDTSTRAAVATVPVGRAPVRGGRGRATDLGGRPRRRHGHRARRRDAARCRRPWGWAGAQRAGAVARRRAALRRRRRRRAPCASVDTVTLDVGPPSTSARGPVAMAAARRRAGVGGLPGRDVGRRCARRRSADQVGAWSRRSSGPTGSTP